VIGVVTTQVKRTCNECYFRRAGLCALPGDTPCPTFRAESRGSLGHVRQDRVTVPARRLLQPQHA
jgi:hypothetical protein